MKLAIAAQTGSAVAWRTYDGASGIESPGAERWGGAVRHRSAAGDSATLGLSGWYDAQVRGLSDALVAANGALTLAQAAEAALGEVRTDLETVRDLVHEARSSTATEQEREALQTRVEVVVADIDRIAQQSVYDARRLQDRTFDERDIRVAPNAHAWVSIRMHSARSSVLGLEQATVRATSTSSTVTTDPFTEGDLELNGVGVRATEAADDAHSTEYADASAIAKVTAINASTDDHDVRASANPNEVSGSGPVLPGLIGVGDLAINAVAVDPTGVEFGDSDSALRNVINAQSDQTGVSADVDENGQLVIRAEDGRNIRVALQGSASDVTRLEAGLHASTISVRSDDDITVAGDQPEVAGLQAGTIYAIQMTAELVADVDVSTTDGADTALETVEEALAQIEQQIGRASGQLADYEDSVVDLARSALDTWAPRGFPTGRDDARLAAQSIRDQLQRSFSDVTLAHAGLPPQMILTLLA